MPYSDLQTGRFSQNNQIYFVTTVLHQRKPLFQDLFCGKIIVHEMKTLHERNVVDSLAWVVMPDHVHWLFKLNNILRNVHEITSTTNLSFCSSSRQLLLHCSTTRHPWRYALWQQLRSLLCACYHALKTNKNPTPVVKLIPCAFLTLSKTMQQFKAHTAHNINKYFNQKGTVWQKAYYDHALRKEDDIKGISRYTSRGYSCGIYSELIFADSKALKQAHSKLCNCFSNAAIGTKSAARNLQPWLCEVYIVANPLRAGIVKHIGDYPLWDAVWI